jgi:hypothetical protein
VTSYNVTAVPGILTITRAAPGIELTASTTAISAGSPVTFNMLVGSTTNETPTGTMTIYSGSSQLGTATLSNGAATFTTAKLAPGSDSVTAVYSGDTGFSPSTSSPAFVEVSDFSLTVSPGSAIVLPGGKVLVTLTASAKGGAFTNAIGFSTSGLPAGATATFDPPIITPGAASAESTLTIVAPGLKADNRAPRTGTPRTGLAICVMLPLLGILRIRRVRRRALRRFLTALLAVAGAVGIGGCGGYFFLQPPQSYTITITSTSGTDVHSTTFQLTVE